jgi:hypothetical protein
MEEISVSAEFYYPERALAFFVILVIALFVARSHLLRKAFAKNLQTHKSLDRSHSFHAPRNRIFKEVLFILALVFVALALMRPRWGEKSVVEKYKVSMSVSQWIYRKACWPKT